MIQFFLNHITTIIGTIIVLAAILIPAVRNKIFQTLFGIVIVPEDSIGLITKKFVLFGEDKQLPEGRIIATKGEAGYQAQTLPPGLHLWKWIWQYEITLQKLTVIESGRIGLILSRDGKDLPNGQVLARYAECEMFQDAVKFMNNGGTKGRQTQYLTPGTYRINTLLFEVKMVDQVKIAQNTVGIVTVTDGVPLQHGHIAGSEISGHNKFQDPDSFLNNNGSRGLQSEVILSGLYNINPWFATVEETPMTEIPIGNVGVVVSYFGKEGADVSGDSFRHGNIVMNGEKGVWALPLQPGKYPINKYIAKIEPVPTTNLVLNWADSRNESHKLDANLSTICVRSKDGFTFNLDVSQIIHVPMTEAPKVIARFGSMVNLVNQVLEPTIGNYFRNSAQNSDVIDFLKGREERQADAKRKISEVLDGYNVHAVDTLIGDITPPEALMKTLTDRKIAQEENETYKQRMVAEKTRQDLEKERSLADMQPQLVTAEQSVIISERNAAAEVKRAEGEKKSSMLKSEGVSYQMSKEAEGEASKINSIATARASEIRLIGESEASATEAKGTAVANSYKQQVDAIGADNLSRMNIVQTIATGGIQIVPKVFINGNGGGGSTMEGLLGMQLFNQLNLTEEDQKKG